MRTPTIILTTTAAALVTACATAVAHDGEATRAQVAETADENVTKTRSIHIVRSSSAGEDDALDLDIETEVSVLVDTLKGGLEDADGRTVSIVRVVRNGDAVNEYAWSSADTQIEIVDGKVIVDGEVVAEIPEPPTPPAAPGAPVTPEGFAIFHEFSSDSGEGSKVFVFRSPAEGELRAHVDVQRPEREVMRDLREDLSEMRAELRGAAREGGHGLHTFASGGDTTVIVTTSDEDGVTLLAPGSAPLQPGEVRVIERNGTTTRVSRSDDGKSLTVTRDEQE